MQSEVLIVGAGPVGMTMAAELSRFGISVRIVDKAAGRTDKSKALVLWSRTLELFDRAGSAARFVAAGQKVQSASIIAGGKPIGHVDISSVASPFPYALMLPQSETERLLDEHLSELGITVERQVEAVSFTAGESGVKTLLRHADGREESVNTSWLIGCDGAHSIVRHQLGMSFEGDTLQSDWMLADIHLEGFPFAPSEIATYWHEDGVLVIFPITPGRFRVVADGSPSVGDHPRDPTLFEVQAVIDRRGPPGLKVSNPIWLSAFRINERKVKNYRSGRVFLAGDAAHVHSPAGGQGMNTGMQDAFNLAWKLALVCQNACSASLLDSYSEERSAIGEQVLSAAGRLTAVATLQNHTAQAIRNLIGHVLLGLAPFRDALAGAMTEVSLGYKKTRLNGPNAPSLAGPAPGERVGPVAGQMPAGAGKNPIFAIFGDADGPASALTKQFSGLIDPEIRPPLGSGGIWLVRPDGYVACAVKSEDSSAIANYLDALT